MASADLTTEEARLIAMYRAVGRFSQVFITESDVSTLTAWLSALVDVDKLDEKDADTIQNFLDGYVSGYAAHRLVTMDLDPDQVRQPVQEYVDPNMVQTGVDPQSGEVRR